MATFKAVSSPCSQRLVQRYVVASHSFTFITIMTRLVLLWLLIAVAVYDSAQAIDRFRAISVLNKNEAARIKTNDDYLLESSTSITSTTTTQTDSTDHDVEELYMQQPLNHFDSSAKNGTLQQRYFYSNRYATKYDNGMEGTFAFLCVGGEGPSLSKSVLMDSVHCTGDMIELAKKLHEEQNAVVHLFALEHRYYGKSFPVFCKDEDNDSCLPSTNEHLQYLSSRQALHDLSRFITIQNKQLSGDNIKWITFGGSYPGMLAAWARLLFPHQIHAAVSNSAPIQAKLDFYGYNNWVGMDLRYPTVGGSKECLKIVQEGHEEIVQALNQGQHEEVAQLFDVCNATSLLSPENVDMFVGDGVIEIPAQENDPSCTVGLCNIEQLCLALITERKALSSSMQALATVYRVERYKETECLKVDWNATLEYLSSPSSREVRSWLWQTCTEFGFYQTCHPHSQWCPYGRGHNTLDTYLTICKVAFGIEPDEVRQNVKETLEYYGGWKLNGTRILSVNGNVDPWSVLALTESNSKELPTHWVTGASHHFWAHPVKKSDSVQVVEARNLIYRQVTEWLLLGNDGNVDVAAQ